MKNRQEKFTKEFLRFEVKNKLFDITDSNGTRVWDIVRHEVGISLLWKHQLSDEKPNNITITTRVIDKIKRIAKSIYLLCINNKKYDVLSITTSINKINGAPCDFNQDSARKLCTGKILTLETMINTSAYNNSYPNSSKRLFSSIYPKKSKAPFYDYQPILDLIESEFGVISITDWLLNTLLHDYYVDKKFYAHLLKRHKIKKVMLTQNGLQKGLFAAAAECGVKVYEFQHGGVSKKNLIYSYPHNIKVENKSYQPNVMFRFADKWFSDFYTPFTTVTIGNDHYSKQITTTATEPNSLLAISKFEFGEELSNYIAKASKERPNWKIYYKLHPNEFSCIKNYSEKFENLTNVELLTDESSIHELLVKCPVIVTVQSSVVHKAIQAKRNVIIIDRGEFNEITAPGIYHIESSQELIDRLMSPMEMAERVSYSDKFNAQAFVDVFNK